MRATSLAALLLWPALALGQTMYKCVDRDKRVTYSNIDCERQGLTNSGVVVDRSMTLPVAPPQDLKPKPKPAPAAPAAAPAAPGPAQPQVVEPKVPPGDAGGMPDLPTVKPPVK